MTDNVIPFRGQTTVDMPPQGPLQAAIDHRLDQVFILGMKDGEAYFAGSTSDVGLALLLTEKFRRAIVNDGPSIP